MSKGLYNGLTAVVGVYAFMVGFILAVCVFMSNASTSSEVSLTTTHLVRSIVLLALVAWPFLTTVAACQGGLFGMLLLVPLCLSVAMVGIACVTSDHGQFEAFSGTGSLRHDAGEVYVIVSLIVLSLAVWRTLAERPQPWG